MHHQASVDDLAQDGSNSIANTLELLQSYIQSSQLFNQTVVISS